MRKQEEVRIENLKLVRKTEKAYLFRQGEIEYWIPISQVNYMLTEGKIVKIDIPEWLAFKTKFDY